MVEGRGGHKEDVMPTYETMLVLDPEMSKEQIDGLVEKLKQFIADRGADVLKVEEWGINTLAYEIKKKHKGYYLLLYLSGDVALVAEMGKTLRLMEEVLRYLIVKREEGDIKAFQQGGGSEHEEESKQEEEPEEEEKAEEELPEDQDVDDSAEEE
jgi:small subunit ribosomal protein S6